jgi:hypothetical protein
LRVRSQSSQTAEGHLEPILIDINPSAKSPESDPIKQ